MDSAELWSGLCRAARSVQWPRRISPFVEAGGVAAALRTASGSIYRGVCSDTACSLGMCAERSAVAAMLTCGEHHITHLVALMPNGKPGLPCGACRELLMQLGPQSRDIQILLDEDTLDTVTLGQLVGDWWGDSRFAE